MKEYELVVSGSWYARVDGNHVIKFSERDLLDSGLEPEAYAKRLFDNAKYPEITWHDFNRNIVHETEQIMGDLEINPEWSLREYLKHDASDE